MKKDKYTPFRYFVLRAEYRGRNKKCKCNLTAKYLKRLWDKQNGICPLTSWSLILPANTGKAWDVSSPMNASLDRIDPNKGYVKGNVRFVSYMANLAKHKFTDEQLIDFCKAVTDKVK